MLLRTPAGAVKAPLRPHLMLQSQPALMSAPILPRRGNKFTPRPEAWALDPKNQSLTHFIPPPPAPKRAPPHPWRLAPAKRTCSPCLCYVLLTHL